VADLSAITEAIPATEKDKEMTNEPKRPRPTLPVKKSANEPPRPDGAAAEPQVLRSLTDILGLLGDRGRTGPKPKRPRLVLRNGTIYIAHGGRRLSTDFAALSGQDFRQHPGAQAALHRYTENLIRSLLSTG
jgi:hypothetical protein